MASEEQRQTRTVRRAPMVCGLLLIGIGATSAMSAQTGLSFAQSGSIWTLVCAAVLLGFLIDRSRVAARESH